MNRLYLYIGFTFIVLLLFSCKSEYTKLVETELAKDIIHTELPLGLSMGLTKKEYFTKCWKLNKDEVIGAGPGNEYAKYMLSTAGAPDSMSTIIMLFYGMFDKKEVMHGMDMVMQYSAWSPWNEIYHTPVLMKTLEEHYLTTYKGNPFISIQVNDDTVARVKVDGNRRITMYPMSNQKVSVRIIDLHHERDILK